MGMVQPTSYSSGLLELAVGRQRDGSRERVCSCVADELRVVA